MADCFSPVHFLSGSSILEPFVLSSGSSNRTSSSDSSVYSIHRLRFRLGQTFLDPDVGMASADTGPVDEGLAPFNPIDVNPNSGLESDHSVNQGEISSDHTESTNLGNGGIINSTSAQIPDIQIVEIRNPEADNTGSLYEPTTENPTTEFNPEDQQTEDDPPKPKASVKGANVYLEYFDGKRGSYRAFRQKYNIPEDVEVRPVRDEDITFSDDHITVPLLSITEGGLRFPVNLLLRQFLFEYQINPRYLAMNSFRIINSLHVLREKFGIIFNLPDLVGVYNVSRNSPSERRFLSLRSTPKEPRPYLIDHLPDSDPWANDFVEVRGNFEFGPDDDGIYSIPRQNTVIGLLLFKSCSVAPSQCLLC